MSNEPRTDEELADAWNRLSARMQSLEATLLHLAEQATRAAVSNEELCTRMTRYTEQLEKVYAQQLEVARERARRWRLW